jgi:ferritin-like metal-binding protein YciE
VKQVFEKLGQAAKGVDCPAIDGIIDEAKMLPVKWTIDRSFRAIGARRFG